MNTFSKSMLNLLLWSVIMSFGVIFLTSCNPFTKINSTNIPEMDSNGTKIENDPKTEAHEEMKQGKEIANTILDALETYKKDKGNYPDTLEELVPGYLREIPQTGTKQNYQYRLNNKGNFELWFLVQKEKRASCSYSNRFEDWDCGYTAEP